MKKTNTTLDREPMSSEAIRERQDFNFVLRETAASRVPLWKSVWFYGPVGIAMVTMVVSAVRMNPKNDEYDNNATLAQNDVMQTAVSSGILGNSSEDTYSVKKAVGPTHDVPKSEVIQTEIAQEQAKKTVENDRIDNNTQLKPVVLAEEKTKIEPIKTAPAPVRIVKNKTVQTMPNIAGVFSGRISVSQICSEGIIHCNNGYEIISYDIQYDNGAGSTVDRVSGNKIPSYICGNLQRYNVGSPVFITKIIAMNENGERKQLLSMSLEPTF